MRAEPSIPPDLLALLCCPETGQPLSVAPPELLVKLEAERVAGRLRDSAGQILSTPVTAALVRADGQLAFPIRDGIPVLLLDETIRC